MSRFLPAPSALRRPLPGNLIAHVSAAILRALTVAAVLLSADVHLELWIDGFRYVKTIGPLFMLNAVAGLLIAIAMLLWWHWFPTFLAIGFGASTLVAFWLSITVGLFGLKEQASGVPQTIAATAEITAVIAGGALLVLELSLSRPRKAPTDR